MSVSERRQRNKDELKALIIENACRIINTEGIENLTMRKIATMIDYTPTTIYKYFKNKEELLSAIVFETTLGIYDNTKSLLSSNLNPDEYFMSGFKLYIKMMIGKSELFKAIIINDMTSDKKFRIFSPELLTNPAVSNISNCISAGIKTGIFAENDVETLTKFVWISIYGLVSRLVLEPGMSEEAQTEIIQCYLEFLLKALKK